MAFREDAAAMHIMWKFLVPNAAKLRGNFIKYGKENHALFTSFRIKLIILKNDRFWNQKTIRTNWENSAKTIFLK